MSYGSRRHTRKEEETKHKVVRRKETKLLNTSPTATHCLTGSRIQTPPNPEDHESCITPSPVNPPPPKLTNRQVKLEPASPRAPAKTVSSIDPATWRPSPRNLQRLYPTGRSSRHSRRGAHSQWSPRPGERCRSTYRCSACDTCPAGGRHPNKRSSGYLGRAGAGLGFRLLLEALLLFKRVSSLGNGSRRKRNER